MKRILGYLYGYRKESVLAPLLKMAEAIFELLVPLVMASIIDRGIANNDRGYIALMSVMLVLIGIAGLIMSVSAQFFAAKAAVGASTKLRHGLFAHINTFSYSEIDRLGTSTLITRTTNDVNSVQNGINLTLRLLLRSPFVVFGAMIMAFIVDARASLIFIATIPLLAAAVCVITALTLPMYKRVQGKLDRLFLRTSENLSGARVIRAFGRTRDEMATFSEENADFARSQKRVGGISALLNPITYVIINISVVILLWQSGLRVEHGELTQGEVIALYNYMSQILVELVKLANLIITVTKAIASAHRINSVFEVENTLIGGERTEGLNTDEIIRLDGACLRYGESPENTVSDISLSLKRGETLGIIGGTGSGKSSLVNLIARFYDVSCGSVKIDGVDVREYSTEVLRDKIGIVPQRAALFRMSIRDNIRLGKRDATDEEILAAMDIAQAGDIARDKGLDFMIEEGGKNLSGGQRQRLTIARALVKRPDILILDDSASALDFATDKRLRTAIATRLTGTTRIIVSQRTSAVSDADKILVLSEGECVALDTHENLLQGCSLYREIYDSQFKAEDRA